MSIGPQPGFAGGKLDELVEIMLRMLLSLIVDPGRPARTGPALRRFVHDWVAPAITAHRASAVGQLEPHHGGDGFDRFA